LRPVNGRLSPAPLVEVVTGAELALLPAGALEPVLGLLGAGAGEEGAPLELDELPLEPLLELLEGGLDDEGAGEVGVVVVSGSMYWLSPAEGPLPP
jgi:hypothetical protein